MVTSVSLSTRKQHLEVRIISALWCCEFKRPREQIQVFFYPHKIVPNKQKRQRGPLRRYRRKKKLFVRNNFTSWYCSKRKKYFVPTFKTVLYIPFIVLMLEFYDDIQRKTFKDSNLNLFIVFVYTFIYAWKL